MTIICPNCRHSIDGLEQPPPHEVDATLPFTDPRIAETAAGGERAAPADQRVGPTLGQYELLGQLGTGGMGVVYKARQIGLNRLVAVKMIRSGSFAGEAEVKRFQMEAQAAAGLRHKNIVAIHEVGEHDGQHFFSMDYVEGPSLAQLIRENPLSQQQSARYVKTIAEAIHYAHENGTLHRDIKPANILIDQDGQPKVTDFGLAKRVEGDSGLTGSGQVLGTPSYMPPEQADPKRGAVGPASDVYSLGALLYELLTGRPPFRAENPIETMIQVLGADPVSPRLLNPKLSRDIETVCLKCLEKEPRKRYATARELAEELERTLDNVPILARPVGAAERLARWCKRNPKIAALSATSAALFLFAFIAVTTFAAIVRHQNGQIAQEKSTAVLQRGIARREEAEAKKQRELAEQNLVEVERQRLLAESSFQQARNAVDDFLSRVGHERLLNEPGMEPLRNDLLKLALTYHQGFLKQRGDDLSVQAELASSYARVGRITQDMGTLADALAAYQNAVSIQEEVVRKHPESVEFRYKLAEMHRGIVDPLRIAGRASEAIAHAGKALALNEKLANEQPGARFQTELAGSYASMGTSLLVAGQLAEAAEYLQKGIGLEERLVSESAEDLELLVELGGKLNNLGIVYARSQRFEEAEQAILRAIGYQRRPYDKAPSVVRCAQFLANHYGTLAEIQRALSRPEESIKSSQEGIEIIRRLSRENPAVIDHKDNLAGKLHSLGMAQSDLKQYPLALATLQESCMIRERLAEDDPDNMEYRNRLGGTWHEIGIALNNSGQPEEAVAAYQKAIAYQRVAVEKAPRAAMFRAYLGNHYSALAGVQLQLRRPAEAAAAAQALRPLVAGNPAMLYKSASLLARSAAAYDELAKPPPDFAALRQASLDQAVQSLRDAIAAGFKDFNKLRTDPNLNALREDAGFKELIGNS